MRGGEVMSQGQCPKRCEGVKAEGLEGPGGAGKSEVRGSKTSIGACSCGPECGPDKCDGRNRSVLVGWDNLRTKIFLLLFGAFVLWLLIYVPVSLTLLRN